jgi:excisionase family DNA binding protein
MTTMVRGLSVSEVARLAGVSVRFVHKCLSSGSLQAKRVGKHYRVPHSVALAFAVECGAEPEAPATSRTVQHNAHNAHGSKLTLARG